MTISQAVILCGGYGKRLGKITLKTPKPLIKVQNLYRTFDFIFFKTRNLKEIILLSGYKNYSKKYHNKIFF